MCAWMTLASPSASQREALALPQLLEKTTEILSLSLSVTERVPRQVPPPASIPLITLEEPDNHHHFLFLYHNRFAPPSFASWLLVGCSLSQEFGQKGDRKQLNFESAVVTPQQTRTRRSRATRSNLSKGQRVHSSQVRSLAAHLTLFHP